jgi:hypothetical protein
MRLPCCLCIRLCLAIYLCISPNLLGLGYLVSLRLPIFILFYALHVRSIKGK